MVNSIEALVLMMLGLVLYYHWGKRLFLHWRIVTPQNWRQFGLAHVPIMTMLGTLGASTTMMTLAALCLMVAFESPVLSNIHRYPPGRVTQTTHWHDRAPDFPPVITSLQNLNAEQKAYLLALLEGRGVQREVFALRLQGDKLADIARRLNYSLNTIKDYQRRACRYLEEQHPGLTFDLGGKRNRRT